MTVNSYLTDLSNKAIIRDREKENIQASIGYLRNKLDAYFGDDITDRFIFGSYDRGTILPRQMDKRSDIDYMIVFRGDDLKPQAYLNKLRRFVHRYYGSSSITQSNPTIILTLNHIRFELVPAIKRFYSGLSIPAKASDYDNWVSTDPRDFNEILIGENQSNRYLIKPVIRLAKYWNAKNSYVFDSYELEKKVVEYGFFFRQVSNGKLKDYYFDFMEDLDVSIFSPKWKREKIERLHKLVELTKKSISDQSEERAEKIVKTLLPNVLLPIQK